MFHSKNLAKPKILIIKFGALGDILLAGGAIQTIVHHYGQENCTIMTQPQFQELLGRMAGCALVALPRQPRFLGHMAYHILKSGYSHVFDLQTATITDYLYYLVRWRVHYWNGRVPNPWQDKNPNRNHENTVNRLKKQICYAGIPESLPPNVDFFNQSTMIIPKGRYGLLAIGTAPSRPDKRFGIAGFQHFAQLMHGHGIMPVLIAGNDCQELGRQFAGHCQVPFVNMIGQTKLDDIVRLARGAEFAIGNDTGPMHLITLAGCKCAWLFSPSSSPTISEPFGANFAIFQFNAQNQHEIENLVAKFCDIN